MLIALANAFPKKEAVTFEWVLFLVVGIIVGFRLRDVVLSANPAHPLVGLDWGILVGAIIYYSAKFLR